jgi:hypothetical protein
MKELKEGMNDYQQVYESRDLTDSRPEHEIGWDWNQRSTNTLIPKVEAWFQENKSAEKVCTGRSHTSHRSNRTHNSHSSGASLTSEKRKKLAKQKAEMDAEESAAALRRDIPLRPDT